MNQPPRNLITQYLFCNHDWTRISDLKFYNGVENKKNKLLDQAYFRWECENCGRIKKLKIV